MAVSTGTRKRTQPSTHPSVFVGLLMAIGGLLLAMYAYTGTRIYDRTFAYVAMAGGALALSGILVSAWGRAIMASRAQRARRLAVREEAQQPKQEGAKPARRGFAFGRKKDADERAPPTVAAPADKKRALMPALPKLGRRSKTNVNGGSGPQTFFAFKRKADDAAPATGSASASVATKEETPAQADPTADGAIVRITLRCPECSEQFTAEGAQPLTVTCPSCNFSGTV